MDREALRTTGRVPHGGSTDHNVLDFSANINPYTPDGVGEVYGLALGESRRYPDDSYPAYREAAAAYVGCTPEDVIPTPGGLAAIRLAIEATVSPGDEVLVPYPSFGEYAREVRLQGARVRFVPHDELLEAEPAGCALAICCTPNNPTGEAADPDQLASFATRCGDNGTALLVDEAFLGFTSIPSMAGQGLENVIVARSLTKLFGLPGLRAGFAVAVGEQRAALETARPAWNLGTPAARVGAHCLAQEAFIERTRERLHVERARLREALSSQERFAVFPSDGPYLLVAVAGVGERVDGVGFDREGVGEPSGVGEVLDEPSGGSVVDGSNDSSEVTSGNSHPVDDLLERTRAAGVVIRDARTFRGLDSHVRVAVKHREANDRLLAALGSR